MVLRKRESEMFRAATSHSFARLLISSVLSSWECKRGPHGHVRVDTMLKLGYRLERMPPTAMGKMQGILNGHPPEL
jgi:hypothetical protein